MKIIIPIIKKADNTNSNENMHQKMDQLNRQVLKTNSKGKSKKAYIT